MNEVAEVIKSSPKLQGLKRTWSDKKILCEQWQQSGKSKTKFCEEKSLSLQTFRTWCDKLWPQALKQKNLSKVVVVNKNKLEPESNHIKIEILLPNDSILRFSLVNTKLAEFIMEICYANTIIR